MVDVSRILSLTLYIHTAHYITITFKKKKRKTPMTSVLVEIQGTLILRHPMSQASPDQRSEPGGEMW